MRSRSRHAARARIARMILRPRDRDRVRDVPLPCRRRQPLEERRQLRPRYTLTHGRGLPPLAARRSERPHLGDRADVERRRLLARRRLRDVPRRRARLGRRRGELRIDPDGFRVADLSVRRVEPRNTPSVINAVFNCRNFWDGRASHELTGVDSLGTATRAPSSIARPTRRRSRPSAGAASRTRSTGRSEGLRDLRRPERRGGAHGDAARQARARAVAHAGTGTALLVGPGANTGSGQGRRPSFDQSFESCSFASDSARCTIDATSGFALIATSVTSG